MNKYSPEKDITNNRIDTFQDLVNAHKNEKVLSCKVVKCCEDGTIEVKIGKYTGTVNPDELVYNTNKIDKKFNSIKLVGHYIKAIITDVRKDEEGVHIELSRKKCQQKCKHEFIDNLTPGDVIPAVVDGAESYGLFCDIGCGIMALLPTSNICMMPILDVKEQIRKYDKLNVVIQNIDAVTGKIILSHKELLGTWDDEIVNINQGDTIIGTVINTTDFGVFISVGQNLKGVADLDENFSNLNKGDTVSVYIKSINKEKMKVRLKLIDKLEEAKKDKLSFKYYITEGNVSDWRYSPDTNNRG
ncbi:MAG: S1 RNA-binding domain-containing protein [Lachnospiraceae bacterium]|nr:S1 RNA-binding domain-containing protein [Lachnospiraceae bacterium]